MCSAKMDVLEHAPVGVLAYAGADGGPRACAVTPYVVGGLPTVTSTLALIAKMRAIRDRPTVALLASGVHVAGDAAVAVRDAAWFDRELRAAELAKYPPARSLLAVPFHRRLFRWYVGRVVASIAEPVCTAVAGDDRATVIWIADGSPRIRPLAIDDLDAPTIPVPEEVADGPAVVLVHEEHRAMRDLRQVWLTGAVQSGVLQVEHSHGSVQPTRASPLGELRRLRSLSRSARRNQALLRSWSEPDEAP